MRRCDTFRGSKVEDRRKEEEMTGVNPFYRFWLTFDDEDVIY